MARNHLVVAALAVMTTVLTACGGSTDHGTDHGTNTTSTQGTTTSAQATTGSAAAPSGEHNDADIAFAQGMIPHHEGAIRMARLAPSRTTNTRILDLAARVEKAQDPEIKTMTAWLDAWGASAKPGGGHDGHGSSMPGMSDEDTAKLEAAEDADFDRTFLELMIEHHQGAIDMSNMLLGSGRNADAKKLAGEIISAQQAEITEMEGLLKTVG